MNQEDRINNRGIMEIIERIEKNTEKIHSKVDSLSSDFTTINTKLGIKLPEYDNKLENHENDLNYIKMLMGVETDTKKKFYKSPKFQTGVIASGGAGLIYIIIEIIKYL